ncbi:MAG: GNAT family N-acetyltransferase [Pseudobdellovibrionaceae bacterium]
MKELLNNKNSEIFKTAEVQQSEDISELVNSVYRGETSQRGWTSEASFLDGQRTDAGAISEIIQKKDNVLLTLWRDSLLLASVHLEKQNEVCHLGMLSVHFSLQDQGFGKKMLSHSEKWARETWQCRAIEMEVISIRTELVEYYLRRGFCATGAKVPFPYNDQRFGLPKIKDLEFIVLRKEI